MNNQQYFCPSTIILPTELRSFFSDCDGETENIKWETISEENVSHFILESTHDGLLFEPVKKVQAVGNSHSANQYEVRLDPTTSATRLYRLKMVDIDGKFEYSSLILRNNCLVRESLISSVSSSDEGVQIGFNDPVSYSLHNHLGQVILQSDNESMLFISTNDLPDGVYVLRAHNQKGETETRKIFVH